MTNCGSCGKTIADDMRFCPYCGQPVAAEEMERFEPSKGEVITAVAHPARIEGRTGTFALAFTHERVLFARMDDVSSDKAKEDLLRSGIFLPGSMAGTNVSRFYEMSPSEVLAEDQGNFHLDNSEVDSVRLAYDSDEGGRYVVTIRTGEGSFVLTLPYDRYCRDLLFRQYEGRVTW